MNGGLRITKNSILSKDIWFIFGEFNSTKLDYVTRVRSFSGAGKDDRVRHIMVSNRHLEELMQQLISNHLVRHIPFTILFYLTMMNIMGAHLDYSIGETGDGSSAENSMTKI